MAMAVHGCNDVSRCTYMRLQLMYRLVTKIQQ